MKGRVENGVVYTPPELADQLAGMIRDVEQRFLWPHGNVIKRVYDPCCGDGALLRAAENIWSEPTHYVDGWDI